MRILFVVVMAVSLLTGCSGWPKVTLLDGTFYYSPLPIGFEGGGRSGAGAGAGNAPDAVRPAQQ